MSIIETKTPEPLAEVPENEVISPQGDQVSDAPEAIDNITDAARHSRNLRRPNSATGESGRNPESERKTDAELARQAGHLANELARRNSGYRDYYRSDFHPAMGRDVQFIEQTAYEKNLNDKNKQ